MFVAGTGIAPAAGAQGLAHVCAVGAAHLPRHAAVVEVLGSVAAFVVVGRDVVAPPCPNTPQTNLLSFHLVCLS
jgi:hypothetical protein